MALAPRAFSAKAFLFTQNLRLKAESIHKQREAQKACFLDSWFSSSFQSLPTSSSLTYRSRPSTRINNSTNQGVRCGDHCRVFLFCPHVTEWVSSDTQLRDPASGVCDILSPPTHSPGRWKIYVDLSPPNFCRSLVAHFADLRSSFDPVRSTTGFAIRPQKIRASSRTFSRSLRCSGNCSGRAAACRDKEIRVCGRYLSFHR